jgi:hypothetical protein
MPDLALLQMFREEQAQPSDKAEAMHAEPCHLVYTWPVAQ